MILCAAEHPRPAFVDSKCCGGSKGDRAARVTRRTFSSARSPVGSDVGLGSWGPKPRSTRERSQQLPPAPSKERAMGAAGLRPGERVATDRVSEKPWEAGRGDGLGFGVRNN